MKYGNIYRFMRVNVLLALNKLIIYIGFDYSIIFPLCNYYYQFTTFNDSKIQD